MFHADTETFSVIGVDHDGGTPRRLSAQELGTAETVSLQHITKALAAAR